MTGQSRFPLTLLLFSCLAACDSETDLAEPSELRAFPTGSYWDEVRCDEDSPTLCYGHRAGTGAVWSRVYSDCYLDDMVTAGWLVPSAAGWGANSCDPYGVPTSTPEYACYTMFGSPICFGGDDGWWSQAYPGCQNDGYTSNYFATGSCITTIYASGFDAKKGKAGVTNKARGWIDDDQFEIQPRCYVDNYNMVGMDADSCDPPWPMLECWQTANGPVCVGYREGESMRVIAPTVFADAVDAGAYILEEPPSCSIDSKWEDVTCFHAYGSDDRLCVGLLDNVLVPSADPCEDDPGAGHVEFYGLYAYEDDPVNYYGMTGTPWPG